MNFQINDDGDWEQLCSLEYDSSTTTATAAECRYINIMAYPPTRTRLLEIALRKLSQMLKFSTHLSHIHTNWVNHRFISTVCEALIHSTAQQRIQVDFVFLNRMTCEQFLPVANLMKNCKREIELCIDVWHKSFTNGVSVDALRNLACAVTDLKMYGTGVGDDGACALSENLKFNTTLTSLNLKDNMIGDKGAEALADALTHNGTLTKLNLWNNSIGKKGGVAIGDALLCNRTLEILNLGGNAIGDEGAIGLAAGLRGCSSLRELHVSCARIGERGGVALGEALAFSSALERLEIYVNPIGDEGAIAIASSLVRNATLKVLGLHNIGMGTEGCSALACALRSNTSLKEFDISENYRIGDEGVASMAETLMDNASLKKLAIGACDVDDEGAIALAEAIARNVTLVSLDLRHNSDITVKVGIAALVNGLNRNSTLTKFNIDTYHKGIKFALHRNSLLLEEPAWMKRFSDQDIQLKGKVLSKALKRYSLSKFSELTFLFLKSQVSTIAETVALSHPAAAK